MMMINFLRNIAICFAISSIAAVRFGHAFNSNNNNDAVNDKGCDSSGRHYLKGPHEVEESVTAKITDSERDSSRRATLFDNEDVITPSIIGGTVVTDHSKYPVGIQSSVGCLSFPTEVYCHFPNTFLNISTIMP